ncbi:hypothetical protein GGF32_007354 [Allomyces javanicus]|nr:hypothetical protein GGF32_007354 [Allomyces javanicus]
MLNLSLAQVNGINTFVAELTGLDTLWALKKRIDLPVKDIIQIEVPAPEAQEWFHTGLRVGTHLPGVISKGTWFTSQGKVFYFLSSSAASGETIGFTLNKETEDIPFIKVVLEVPAGSTGAEWKARIEAAQQEQAKEVDAKDADAAAETVSAE